MDTLSGTWKVTASVGHNKGTATFDFLQNEDGSLRGTYTGLVGSATVAGKADGKRVEFSFNTERGGRVTYLGSLVGDEMSGTCTYAAAGSGSFHGHRA
jgi:hypothetical protein